MTLKQLEAFYWAAKLGTFAIAAQRLHLTQSSLSKRIAELESDLGYLLFDRSNKRAKLTEAGAILVDHAAHMLRYEELIRSQLEPTTEISGACRFGLTELSATTWFPSFVHHLTSEYPKLTIHPEVGLAKSLERSVEKGELDCAIISGIPSNSNIASEVVNEVEFCWAASPKRLKAGTYLTREQFQNHPLITSTQDSGLIYAYENLINNYGLNIKDVLTCNSLTAIISLTISGEGISFLPKKYIDPLIKRKLLTPIKTDPEAPSLKYSFIFRRDENRRLINLLRDLALTEVDFSRPNDLWVN